MKVLTAKNLEDILVRCNEDRRIQACIYTSCEQEAVELSEALLSTLHRGMVVAYYDPRGSERCGKIRFKDGDIFRPHEQIQIIGITNTERVKGGVYNEIFVTPGVLGDQPASDEQIYQFYCPICKQNITEITVDKNKHCLSFSSAKNADFGAKTEEIDPLEAFLSTFQIKKCE